VKTPLTAAILTVSDRCSRGAAEDTAGPALGDLLHELVGAEIVATECVPDETESIAHVLTAWANEAPRPDLILTTGGTGLAPRDVTPEATAQVLERRHPALLELARSRCYPTTALAALSRGEAGTVARSLVINLPGSVRGATQTLSALIDVLPHAIAALRGEEEHGPR
jgi:molybdenum cofactor synthesis domain-containing protein